MEKELLKKEYSMIYANDPRTPYNTCWPPNRAAKVHEAKDTALAQQSAREALGVFEEGVRRHYYTQSQIDEPIMRYIRRHIPIKVSCRPQGPRHFLADPAMM